MSSEFVNRGMVEKGVMNSMRPRFDLDIWTAVGGMSREPITLLADQDLPVNAHIFDRKAHSKKPKHDFEGLGKRVPPPLWYRQIGDGIHTAIGDLLEKTNNFPTFFKNSRPIQRLGRRLREVNRNNSECGYPRIEDIRAASVSVAAQVAEFLSIRYRGREVHHITEASFSPNLPAYQASADRLNALEKSGALAPEVSLGFTRPYALGVGNGINAEGLNEQTIVDLKRVGSSSTTRVDVQRGRASTATDWIRPDIITISYLNTERNKDMPDLLKVLDNIKKGKTGKKDKDGNEIKGKRANILDFESWVNEKVKIGEETMTAEQAMKRFIGKVIAGDVKLTVNEVKTHMNGYSRIGRDVDNSNGKLPYVSFSDLEYDLRQDLAITTDALWRFLGQFEPKLLYDEETKKQALRHMRTVLIDINLNLIRHGTRDKAHARARDLQEPNPQVKICQFGYSDLDDYWKDRNWVVFYTRTTRRPRRKSAKDKKREQKTTITRKVTLVERNGHSELIEQHGRRRKVLHTKPVAGDGAEKNQVTGNMVPLDPKHHSEMRPNN